jgi:ABC-type transport system substrate-binding protein
VLVVALAACNTPGPRTRAAGHTSPVDGGTLHLAIKDQIGTLDPTFSADESSLIPMHALFATLLDYAPGSTRLVPALAADWNLSPDGLTYTFHLRPGITYSDGAPVVAADFKYSFERALTSSRSGFGPYLAAIDGAPDVLADKARDCAGITAPVPDQLVVRLTRPDASFPYVLAMWFTTPQRAADVAAAGDQLRREPRGTGPFVLELWDEGQRVVLGKNPRYWAASRVHVDRVELRENLARGTQFLMFERGELDGVEKLAAPDYLAVEASAEWQPYVHRLAAMTAFGSRMNVRVKPFDDRRVRQALNYALDKQHTVKLLNGAAVAAHGVLPPGVPGRDDALPPYPHDPAKARALLAAAGYPDGFAVDYVIRADEEAERLAGSLQRDLAEVGVAMRITEMTEQTYAAATSTPDGAPFSKVGWLGDFPDATSFLDTQFHSRAIGSTNTSFYTNPELDALLDAARAEPDPDRRSAMYRRAERIVYDDAPWLFDYHQVMTEVTQPYVRGYAPHPVWLRDYASAWLDLGDDGRPVSR